MKEWCIFMTMNISVAGKGGTGKTTFTSLVIRELIKSNKKPILAVDADANANLNEALGMEVEETIAELLSRINNNIEPLPAGMTKDQYVQYKINQSLIEGDDVDLLVMGGPEGAGCYCYANNLLKGFIDDLRNNYDYFIMDNEAGMEHLSRRVTHGMDHLFVISDSSARSIRSAGRIKELLNTINLDIKNLHLVITKCADENDELMLEEVKKAGINLIGIIPVDEQVYKFDLHSKPLFDLPDDSPAVVSVRNILKKVGVL